MEINNESLNGDEPVDSRFRLIVVAALRAKQLFDGAKPRIEVDIARKKNTSIAMEEVRRGLVHYAKITEPVEAGVGSNEI
jgi:DNA-directed RNA polymerase omega subunit